MDWVKILAKKILPNQKNPDASPILSWLFSHSEE